MHTKNIYALLICLLLGIKSYSQAKDTLITIELINVRIDSALMEIGRYTGYTVFAVADDHARVTLKVIKMPLHKLLETLYAGRPYFWKISQRSIVIKRLPQKTFTLKGKITNLKKEPLTRATIAIAESRVFTLSNDNGEFSLTFNRDNFILKISYTGYVPQTKKINGESFVNITMEPNVDPLKVVDKVASKTPPKDTISSTIPDIKTGSEFKFDDKLKNWPIIQNITDLFSAATGALLVNQTSSPELNQAPLTIRNRITIFGNPNTLIILDNFPYHGDINNINPNDIETISIVKDAAASTQWGVHAGNGVIVITTKKGFYNKQPKVSATANITVGMKPNLQSLHTLSAADHIELTNMLFRQGYYHNILQNTPYAVIPPAAEILFKQEKGLLTASEAEEALNNLRQTDIRKEAGKYLYRKGLHQQYHVGVTGGTEHHHYYYSIGYDVTKSNLIGNDNNRLTMNLNNTIQLGKNGPELFSDLYFNRSTANNNGFDINELLFHQKLADEQGNALPVTQSLNQTFKDSITRAAHLLDWNYKPLDEIKQRNNTLNKTIFLFTTGLRFKWGKKWEGNAVYRHEKDLIEEKNLHSLQTYFTRNLINEFTQIDSQGIYRPIPLGGILDENTSKRVANNISAQLKFKAINKASSTLTFYGGTEIRHIITMNQRMRRYGITESGSSAIIDYVTSFMPSYASGLPYNIPNDNGLSEQRDHFYSIYTNGVYTWKKRFAASFTIRKDESNIFGAQANQKGIPLVSAGVSWDVYPESYDNSRLFSQLRVRLTNGYCGNTSKSYSTLTGFQTSGINTWNSPAAAIPNPSNPKLAWETVRISNMALDFSLLNKKISGTAECFVKEGTNLLGLAPIDPTGGFTLFQGNVASMKGHGVELALNTNLTYRSVFWQGTLLMSYIKDQVTRYYILAPENWYFCDPQFISPKEGNPLYSIYSFDMKGFDPVTGEPIGVLNNTETKDYNAIIHSTDFSELIFHGPATPTFYGSFRNTISWKRLELGFNILFKAGYYFKRSSLNFQQLVNGASARGSDFSYSMMRPGGDRITNIPFMQNADQRDVFYNYSSDLVEKGDHIRLQDIRLKYSLLKNASKQSFWSLSECYLYANNVGLLWKAIKKNLDPDFPNKMAAPLTITIGFKAEF